MHDLALSAASFLPDALVVLGILLVFLAGAAAGYVLRGWQNARARRPDAGTDAAPRESSDVADLQARRRTIRPASQVSRSTEEFPSRPAAPELRDPAIVLVADDRMELVALHATYLERHGYQVVRALDGLRALELARSEHPSVIVLDHSMPGLSGLEVTRALKADPDTADIPILLMTAHSYGAVGATARAAGCAGFMPKPCDPSRVLREVASYVTPAPEHHALG